MLDPEIAVQLRLKGWDVEAIQRDHPELLGLDDAVLLEELSGSARVLVTDNVADFTKLHQLWLSQLRVHSGMLLASPRSFPRSKLTIGLWVAALIEAIERLRGTSTENLCEWLPPWQTTC